MRAARLMFRRQSTRAPIHLFADIQPNALGAFNGMHLKQFGVRNHAKQYAVNATWLDGMRYGSSGARCILTNDHRSSSLFYLSTYSDRLAVVRHKYVSNAISMNSEFYLHTRDVKYWNSLHFLFFIHVWRQFSNSNTSTVCYAQLAGAEIEVEPAQRNVNQGEKSKQLNAI